jgi:phosphoglycolate phosphatase-like HAD superfamily hydrolase
MPDQLFDFNYYRTAVFDCDGVILDSNKIKSDAFRQALAKEPIDAVEQFIAYHHAHGGVSRYVKFEYFYTVIFPLLEAEKTIAVAKALERYAAIVREALACCETIPGVLMFLEALNAHGVRCCVNSGGDQTELRAVFAERGIAHLFHNILGSPATKQDNLAYLSEQQLLNEPAVFFGDALSDCQAATAFNMDFIYISGCSEWQGGKEFCNENSLDQYQDFTALLAI